MDYEHKDALDRARNLHKDAIDMGAKDVIKICEIIFPELSESEDEKTRKALISFLKSPFVNENITDEKVAPWLAWLEKQGQVKENQILQHEGTHEDISCKENDNSLTREQKPQRFISAEAKEALYDKPAWSEEDEKTWK